MTNLTPTNSWDDVYQLETTDKVLGGAGAVANRQAQALVNRSAYLLDQVKALLADLAALPSTTAPLADGDTAQIGSGSTLARWDHVHPHDTTRLGLGIATPLADGAGTVGTSALGAHEDHVHPSTAVAQTLTAYAAGGVAPAYTLTPVPALEALATNDRYSITFAAAGTTGSNKLNVSGLGAKALMQYDINGNLMAATIPAGLVADCVYNGSYWVVLDALPATSISATQQTLVVNEGASAAPIAVWKSGVIAALKGWIANTFTSSSSLSVIQSNLASYIGSATLPANFWVVGKKVKIEMYFSISNAVVGTFSISVLVGGLSVITLPISSLPTSGWATKFEAVITCQAVGAAGTAVLSVASILSGSNNAGTFIVSSLSVKTSSGVATTIANALDVRIASTGIVGSSTVSDVILSVLA